MLFLGDIHGEFQRLKIKLERLRIENEIIIQVGDFGVGFRRVEQDQERLESLNNYLKSRSIILYAIRGNHDNPAYFAKNSLLSFSNLHLVPDYHTLLLEGLNILLVGGAISIDRSRRTANKDWWKDEKFVLDEKHLPSSAIDVVVTHATPSFCPPFRTSHLVSTFAKNDKRLLVELKQERENITKLYQKLSPKPKYWIAGHVHQYHNLVYHNTTFLILDQFQFYTLNTDKINV